MQEIALGVKSLVVQDNRALVLVEPNGRLDLPGGRVEKGERLEEGLRREIFEETGLPVEILGPVASCEFMKNDQLFIRGLTFYCRYLGWDVVLSPEHVRYLWIDLDKMNRPGLGRWFQRASLIPGS